MEERSQAGLIAGLSESDALTVQIKLWHLLGRRTERFTMGDSSSVREETARELLASICFTLELYLRDSGNPPSLLVTADLNELLALGIKTIEKKLSKFERLYEAACLGAPELENISFRDTLGSIGGFKRRYDYRFFAHMIPCDIDYQLYRAVPETLLGVEYLNEYLRRIVIENNFLQRFPEGLVLRLLSNYCPDYKGLLINLYEPVAVNALGLTLIGCDALTLDITEDARAEIARLLVPLPESKARATLCCAAEKLCRSLDIQDSGARGYLAKTANDLYPRIDAALSVSGFEGIFLSIKA